MAAIAGLEAPPVTVLLAGAALAALMAFLLCIWFSKKAGIISGLDRRRLNTGVIVVLVLLTLLLAGPFGIAILILATLVGMVPTRECSPGSLHGSGGATGHPLLVRIPSALIPAICSSTGEGIHFFIT